MKEYKLVLFLLLFFNVAIFAQTENYINEPAGDPNWVKVGFMNGNRVSLKFFNNTQLGDWPATDGSEWPIGSGIKMNDGIALLIGEKLIIDENGNVLPPGSIGADTLYFCQTHYREHQDKDPNTGLVWGFYPVPGYCNPNFDTPALSDEPNSWPVTVWPDHPDWVDAEGNIEWNGFFGRGKTNADLETYFVVNDALDFEYIDKFDPFHGQKIIIDSSGNQHKWGGLGLRVGVRGFQWSNPMARDVVFWHYDCTSMSTNNLYETTLGFWVDNNIGDEGDDEIGIYLAAPINMAYAFDRNGVGKGGIPVGVAGIAYLESPGIPWDSRDNDRDGIINEKRDNDAGEWTENPLEGPDGTQIDRNKFESFYKRRPTAHWTGDEDQDWRPYDDENKNGKWDPGEFIYDDVGSDGVGPDDDNYFGPDPDGTEANGRPDQGEPNFGRTDKDESDQVGLTAFRMFPVDDSPDAIWFNNDKTMWDIFTGGLIANSSSGNLIEVFSSGPFLIKEEQTERISLAMVNSWDFPYKNLSDPQVPLLIKKKNTVQNIYNNDYQFAKPPTMPTLKAIADNGRVILTWNDIAESSKDPYLDYINDFEGYKIYKSTEPFFDEPMVITDGMGNPLYRKPVAQFDKIDSITGYSDNPVDGTSYYLGDDTGLQHFWIDTDVQNGRTYYYALVAYDFGYGDPYYLPPSENTIVLKVDEHGNVVKKGKNVAVVTPHSTAAGFVPGDIAFVEQEHMVGTGQILDYSIFNPLELKENHRYLIKFKVNRYMNYSPKTFKYDNTEYCIIDLDDEQQDTVIQWSTVYDTVTTDVFDGIQLKLRLFKTKFWSDTLPGNGWVNGDAYIRVEPGIKIERIPWDYDIIFTDDTIYSTSDAISAYRGVPTLTNYKVPFYVINRNFFTESGEPDTASLLVVDQDQNGVLNLDKDFLIIGEEYKSGTRRKYNDGFKVFFDSTGQNLPKAEYIYQIRQQRPFLETDSLMIKVTETKNFDREIAKKNLDKITVVPNPYIVTNMMEPRIREGYNQQRRLLFNNLPAKCTIRVYTISGNLVKTIEVNNEYSNGSYHWDMLNNDGKEIGFGIYLYHVDAPGVGEHIGKFAIIK